MRLIVIFLFFCSTALAQQLDNLLKDETITWVAEGYQDIVTESIMDKNDTMNYIIPLKLINNEEDADKEDMEERYFSSFLINAINKEKIAIYKDERCTYKISKKDITQCDTVIICFPSDDYNGSGLEVFCLEPHISQILFYRLYQTYYYDSKRTKFMVVNNSMALMKCGNDDGLPIYEPLCWIKVNDIKYPNNLRDSNITWAARIIDRGDKLHIVGSDKKIKELKRNYENPIKVYLEDLKKNSIHIFKIDEQGFKMPIEKEERENLLSDVEKKDTMYNGLSFVQKWYWNNTKNQLEIYLVGVRINASFYNEDNLFKYNAPVFYRRND